MNPEPTFQGGPGQRAAREQQRQASKEAGAAQSGLRGGALQQSPASKLEAGAALVTPSGFFTPEAIPAPAADRAKRSAVRPAPARSEERFEAQERASGRRVPLTVLKNIVGVFLLPAAGVWTVSFVEMFGHATTHQLFWQTEDFWFFMLGVVLWLVAFTGSLYAQGQPPLLKTYVRFHEWTHAIWAWQSNGRVEEIIIEEDRGHILTNKPTVLVTLAPYCYPLPCVVLIVVFLLVQLVYPLEEAPTILWGTVSWVGVFLSLLGVGWAFHFTYTVWMIRRGQSDLRMHGNLFSLVFIYLVNLVVVTLFFTLTAAEVDWRVFGTALLRNAEDFSDVVWGGLVGTWGILARARGAL